MLFFAAAGLPELAALEKYGRDHSSELDSFDLGRENYSPTGRTAGRSKIGIKDQLTMAGFSTALIDACSCDDCNFIDKNLPSQVNSPIPDRLCLSKTAIAIFEFIWDLSWLDMDDTIRPSSTGLMNLFSKNLGEISRADRIRAEPIDSEVFDAFEEVITLLTGFEATVLTPVSKKPSALAMHGLCVYRPSLAHPSVCVEGQLRLRVVPGQIDWNDKLYDRVDEKSIQSPFDQLHDNPTETTELIDMLGANPLLQLTVKETIIATSLSVQLVVSPETKSQVHWNGKLQSSCLISAPGELLASIENPLQTHQYQKTHKSIEMGPVWTANSSINPWSGRCSIIELPWWTHDPGVHGQLLSILRPNDWIIAVRDSKNPNKLQLFCGSFALLYSILSKLFTRAELPKSSVPKVLGSSNPVIV